MTVDPLSYFTEKDKSELAAATTFVVLRDIALSVLARMPPGVCMVCGPISTGGLGSPKKNLEKFARAIDVLARRGENVFTQMPFEDPMRRIREENEGVLLETFYRPVFASVHVVRLCFLPDWMTSFGARWEHDRALELGLEREYFRDDWLTAPLDQPIFKGK